MIDPLLSLSFNLHAQRGTYALLIGSGISRSASIPTGWEVTLDLSAKLAHLQGEDCKGDEIGWYTKKFGKEPEYSELLAALAPTSAAQQHLLKSYFEPTDEERDEGKKLPTTAHKAIAQLVGSGHVRVIVTTNFDRLLESALEANGIAPVVIASADSAKGAPPLVHSKCTIIKVHGDYLDHRIKNSAAALSKYDRVTDKLLDQVFDQYGLIICGWSGEYDVALRKALERSKTRRYPMYWTGLSSPRGTTKDLISLHGAHSINIEGADSFFTSVLEKVEALEEFERPHPISTQAAIVTLKRYLSEEKYRIQLRDFLVTEATNARSSINDAFINVVGLKPDQESAENLMGSLEAGCEKLVHLFANGSFYAKTDQVRSFFDAFHILVGNAQSSGGFVAWTNLRRYPGLLLVYASGLAAVGSENYALLNEIASRPSFIRNDDDKYVSAPVRLYTHNVMERDTARQLFKGFENRKTPVSDYLFGRLREVFRALIPDDTHYQQVFDNFEYLWCLLHVDAQQQLKSGHIWTPYGAFIWRWDRWGGDGRFSEQAQRATTESDVKWMPVSGGLFGGDIERLKAAKASADGLLDRIANELRF